MKLLPIIQVNLKCEKSIFHFDLYMAIYGSLLLYLKKNPLYVKVQLVSII